jgi:hypothetical protein
LQTLYYGPGAGSEATASAIIADILDVARLLQSPASAVPPLGFAETNDNATILPITKICCSYYLRLHNLGSIIQLINTNPNDGTHYIVQLLQPKNRGVQSLAITLIFMCSDY